MSNVINILTAKPKLTSDAIYSFDEWNCKAIDLINKTCDEVRDNTSTKESLLASLIKLSVLVFDMGLTPEEWSRMNPSDAELERRERSMSSEERKRFNEHMTQSAIESSEADNDRH